MKAYPEFEAEHKCKTCGLFELNLKFQWKNFEFKAWIRFFNFLTKIYAKEKMLC